MWDIEWKGFHSLLLIICFMKVLFDPTERVKAIWLCPLWDGGQSRKSSEPTQPSHYKKTQALTITWVQHIGLHSETDGPNSNTRFPVRLYRLSGWELVPRWSWFWDLQVTSGLLWHLCSIMFMVVEPWSISDLLWKNVVDGVLKVGG